MAFKLGFTTIDGSQGTQLLINDASTDWASVPAGVVSATFTITSLYTGAVLTTSTITKTVLVGTVPFTQGFQYTITAQDLYGAAYSGTVKDSIYEIKMEISDGGGIIPGADNTYTSQEVFYYNILDIRDKFVSEKASYIDSVYFKDMDYANWLDFLVTTIEANTLYGNTSAIYYVFDIEQRLSE